MERLALEVRDEYQEELAPRELLDALVGHDEKSLTFFVALCVFHEAHTEIRLRRLWYRYRHSQHKFRRREPDL